MGNRKLGDTFYVDFVCKSLDTGELATPDSGPTVSVYEDGTDKPIHTPSPAVRNSKTGIYKVAIAATSGNGFEAGKSYNIHAEYEWPGGMGALPDGQIIERFTLDSKLVKDLNDTTAASVATAVWAESTVGAAVAVVDGVVDAIKLKTDLLPADPASATNVAAVPAAADALLSTNHGSGSWLGPSFETQIHNMVSKIFSILNTASKIVRR